MSRTLKLEYSYEKNEDTPFLNNIPLQGFNALHVWAWALASGLKEAELLSGLNNEQANGKQA